MLIVWEVNGRRGQTATYWPKVLLTIAALLSQPWATEGPKLSVGKLFSRWHLVPNWLLLQLGLELTQAVCGTWLYFCLMTTCFLWAYASATITEFNHIHRSRWYSDIFNRMHLFRCSSATQVHLLINGSVEGQYVTIIPYLFFKIPLVEFFFTSVSIPLTHTHFTNNAQGQQQRNYKEKLLEPQQQKKILISRRPSHRVTPAQANYHLISSNNPISSTGYTCFTVLPLIYIGASLD